MVDSNNRGNYTANIGTNSGQLNQIQGDNAYINQSTTTNKNYNNCNTSYNT